MPDITNLSAWPRFVILYTLQLWSPSYGNWWKRNHTIWYLGPAMTVDCSCLSFIDTPYEKKKIVSLYKPSFARTEKKKKYIKNQASVKLIFHGRKKVVLFPWTTIFPKEQATNNSVLLILLCWFTYNDL